jgi:hypothetical protein
VIDSFFLEVVKSERILHGNRDNIILVVSLKLADDSREGKLFTLKAMSGTSSSNCVEDAVSTDTRLIDSRGKTDVR